MRKISAVALVVSLVLVGSLSYALTAADFSPTAAFTENFAGGAPTGKWGLDPASAAVAETIEATYVTSTPSGINAAVVTLNPVASASNQACMMMGNMSAGAGTHYGLQYMRCTNSLANETGMDFTATTMNKYRIVARLYLYGTEIYGEPRWQVGPWLFNRGSLFRACSFYNTGSTGAGPGFGWRGATVSNGIITGTAALTASRWTLMSVMVDATDTDPANHKLAIAVDANGNGTFDEADPLEYQLFSLNTECTPGPFGIFTVGDVFKDTHPLFVDWVELYLPGGPSNVNDWTLY